jgi:hypothetical protein
MFRFFLSSCLLSLCSIVQAAQSAAPLDMAASQRIVNAFKDNYEDDFNSEMARVPKFAFPTPEQSYVYAKYMNKAFEKAGYDMDATLYSYFKSVRTGNVIMFMSKINLETYAIFLKNDGVGDAFKKAGAASARTLQYAKDLAREVPITSADYVIEGDPDYQIEGVPNDLPRRQERLLGYVKQGTGPWTGWLYLESLTNTGEQHGIGLVDTRDTLTDGEKYIWQKLINQKVKIEGAYFTVKGVSLGVQGSNLIVTDPSFFDRKFPLAFKTL